MSLILPQDTKINPESLSMDFYLEATRIDGSKTNVSGLNTYTIGAYTDNLGYGITSVDIDVKPNLQPIINITFKDFYGNTAFNRDSGYGLDILWDLPYPKFRLYVRGFVGLPVSFLLQVKSIKTTYQANDGSYEIKAEFVPNVFGFFNDIPYQFLFAVPKLRGSGQSIVQLAKNGIKVQQQIQTVSDKYSDLRNKLNILATGPEAVSDAFNADPNNFLNAIQTTDQDLINNGWKDIKFSIDIMGPRKVKIGRITDGENKTIYGKTILGSINYKYRVLWKSDTPNLKKLVETQEIKDQITNANTLIQNNLAAIQKTSQTVGLQSVDSEVIDSVTIENVMKTLAGDCAYILGYILEGGLNGFNADQSNRIKSKLYGRYYPLEDKATNEALSEQIPASSAGSEIDKVRKFVRALWEGTQEAADVIDYVQNAINGNPSNVDSGPLKKRITNAEFTRQNPYGSSIQDGDLFIVNMLQRSGLMACGYAGPIPSSKIAIALTIDAERKNLDDAVIQLRGTEREKVKTFCENWLNLCDSNGEFKNNLSFSSATKSDATVNYNTYLSGYLNKFKAAAFDQNRATSLKCISFQNNGIFYYSPKQLYNKIVAINANANNSLRSKRPLVNSQPTQQNLSAGQTVLAGAGNGAAAIGLGLLNVAVGAVSSAANYVSGNQSTQGDPGEILCYVPKEVFVTTPPDTFNGDPATDTLAPSQYQSDPIFFKFFKVGDLSLKTAEQGIFVDYTKIADSSISSAPNIDSVLIKRYSSSTNANEKPKSDDYVFILIENSSLQQSSLRDTVLNLGNKLDKSNLTFLVSHVYNTVKKDDKTLDSEAAAKAKKDQAAAAASGQPSPPIEAPATYSEDAGVIRSVYTQFHHLCHAWVSLAADVNGGTLPAGTSVQLADKFQQTYSSSDSSAPFYLNFAYPLVNSQVISVDIRQAIVNTDLLASNDQTSVLNMMQNICSKNNFLLQPIPGGVNSNLKNLFTPQPDKAVTDAVGNNAISIIWAPTPENRQTNNSYEQIYQAKDFFSKLSQVSSKIDVAALQYGSPNNFVVKSIKASTDDNKVTSESIQATADIVNNQNQNQKKGFDCSMLSVMQGRSYSISLDIIGNAQIYPTMNLAVDGLPLFTGLYWVTAVQHKITPNNMETTIEASKMKFDGGQNFSIILPVTKNNSGGSFQLGGGTGSDGFGSGDLNYDFIQQIKDIKITNTKDINDKIIKKFTNNKYADFPSFFNAEVNGKTQFADRAEINTANWEACWDNVIPILWPNYGTTGINFLEFCVIHAIAYNEVGGTYGPKKEGMNKLDNAAHPGIAYAYDKIPGTKVSYNNASKANKTAGELFSDANFIASHGNKEYGNDPKVLRSSDPAWKSDQFPKSLFADVKNAVKLSPATFINEADFYKFAGRGYYQFTWRDNYKRFVPWILAYNGNDSTVLKFKNRWSAAPYSANVDLILTKSSNQDWDELFSSQIMNFTAMKIYGENSRNKNFQYITDLTEPKSALINKINKVAISISGGRSEYTLIHQARVYAILDKLYPQGVKVSYGGGAPTGKLYIIPGLNAPSRKPIIAFSDLFDFTKFKYPMNGTVGGSSFSQIMARFGSKVIKHYGIDIPAPIGNKIYSITKGKVIIAGCVKGYGCHAVYIEVDPSFYKDPNQCTGANKMVIVYGHNSAHHVTVGQDVNQGDLIADCGSEGRSSGPHLHLQFQNTTNSVIVNINPFFAPGKVLTANTPFTI